MTWHFLFVSVVLTAHCATAMLITYSQQYRVCDAGESPKYGEQGQWSCYMACVTTDLYRSLPCLQQMPLTMQCPGIFRLNVYETADSQGFYLTPVERCVYPLYATCTSSQQRTLCNVTSPGCVYYDTFAPARFYNGTCVQPYVTETANNVFRACTSAELTQACYADEMKCTYDETLDRFLFQCPWTASVNGGVWNSNNTVPLGVIIASQCSDVESETRCVSDWRTHVPREPCSRKVVKYHEYKGHEYVYDLSACNRKPCTSAQQLDACGRYTSDCWYSCSTPATCSLSTTACGINRNSTNPARYCTEIERLQTGCVTATASLDECRVSCTSTDLLSGCTLESRCLWSQGYPEHQWNALHVWPNVSYPCTGDDHAAWCGDRNVLDPFRQDPRSLCRKLCNNATGACSLRDDASCNRVPCNYSQQLSACIAPGHNSRCSALAVCSTFENQAVCTYDAYCPTAGYALPSPVGATNASQAYWDSWFSTDAVRVCNATEFAVSCAPFAAMCRRRCPWNNTQQLVYDTLNATQQLVYDVSACTLEQKCTLGAVPWTSFNRDGTTGSNRVRACTTNEWHATCATTLANCRASCLLSNLTNCNITAVCPWSFGYIAQPATDPDPQTCTNGEAISACGSDYTSPCLKYNCTYIGYTDTHTGCSIDVSSCNSRVCTSAEQLSVCGYYTHECRVKCSAAGTCALFGTCGAVATHPARPCNATELLDSCAAFDSDCRVQCLDTNMTWGCYLQNICPWTGGQWIDNQIEPVPYQRGLSFATAIFCGPGWETDSYNNNCQLYECQNTRRLGRHDCTCHYATCYCPFRYSDSTHKCSEDEARILACDTTPDPTDGNVHSVTRYCGQFGRTCALYCSGDKNAPSCDIISPCTCLDDTSFAPLHGLVCQGYAQPCNATEWDSCGLYAATCVRATVNATSSRATLAEPGETTCTCLSGVSPVAREAACRSTHATNDGTILRACTLSEARATCGSYASGCQYHIPTAQIVEATCACNASSVRIQPALTSYASRSTPPHVTCPGPFSVRNCTAGEFAACEDSVGAGRDCRYNTTLLGTSIVNRTACFPDHYDYNCTCPTSIARSECGIGFVSCTVLGTYNQIDGCYNHRANTSRCVCDPLYANYSMALGYTCLNTTSVIRRCTPNEFVAFCGNPLYDGLDVCYVFALNNSLVNGTCNRRTTVTRDCNATEYEFTCPMGPTNQSLAYCKTITGTNGLVYLAVNASCPITAIPPSPTAPPLQPANSTGYPRECTDDEYARECSNDWDCENVTIPDCSFNVSNHTTDFEAFYNVTLVNLTLATDEETNQTLILDAFLLTLPLAYNVSDGSPLPAIRAAYAALNLTAHNATFDTQVDVVNGTSYYVLMYNVSGPPRFNISTQLFNLSEPHRSFTCENRTSVLNNTFTACRYNRTRTSMCVTPSPGNFTCSCQSGYGPLNPRYYISDAGFIRSDPRDANLGQCSGVVRDCDAGDETTLFGGRFATACQISCNRDDRTENCVIYNATCENIDPRQSGLARAHAVEITASALSAFFPINRAQPCGSMGSIYDRASANETIIDVGTGINITSELQRRCGRHVDKASFLIFDCNTTHSLCEPQVRYAVYTFDCFCRNASYPGPAGLACEVDYYTRNCDAAESALIPRGSFDDTCQRNYQCKLMCYPATATQPEVCFRHAPDPCLDVFTENRWCTPTAAKTICGARAHSCYGRCQVHSDLNFTLECDPNALTRCICDTFNTTFYTGLSGQACDRDYVVKRLDTRDNITQWCGILGESGTVRCRDFNDSQTCFQTDACLCQFDAGDGTALGYVGFQTGVANGTLALNATRINNATLNTTTIRRPVFSHCAYVYTIGTASAANATTNETVVSGTSLFRGRKLPWLVARKEVGDIIPVDNTTNASAAEVVLIDNRPVMIGVPTQRLGFSCDYQQKCGTFTEATLTYCDTGTLSCNVTCGCYKGATTMVGSAVPCSAFTQSCDDAQRARCAQLKNVSYVSQCTAACDETNTYCEPLIGTCIVGNPVVIPRYVACSEADAVRYCGQEFHADSCKRRATCVTDPPQLDCFVCDCAQKNGYIMDPQQRYGHHCTNLQDEFFNCTTVQRNACGLRGVTGCRQRLIYGGRYDDLRSRIQFDVVTWTTLMRDWGAGRVNTDLLSGKFGGILIQECQCLSNLFSVLNPYDLTSTTQLNDTLSPTTGAIDNNMRCDQTLTTMLTYLGACPFHRTSGLPCNGAGACEGTSDENKETQAWPNTDIQTKGATWMNNLQRWTVARATGVVWLYSDPAQYESCTDNWCNGAPVTGTVAKQAYPANRFPQDKFRPQPVEGTPMRCISTNPNYAYRQCKCPVTPFVLPDQWEQGPNAGTFTPQNCELSRCTKTFPSGFSVTADVLDRVDTWQNYIGTSTLWADAQSFSLHTTRFQYYGVGTIYTGLLSQRISTSYTSGAGLGVKAWENCVIRRRSKSDTSCYLPKRETSGIEGSLPLHFGPHNVLMADSRVVGQTSPTCTPNGDVDVSYVHVCQEPATMDLSALRALYNSTNMCLVFTQSGNLCSCWGKPYDYYMGSLVGCDCPAGTFKERFSQQCQPCIHKVPNGYWDQWEYPPGKYPALWKIRDMSVAPCFQFSPLPDDPSYVPLWNYLQRTVYSNEAWSTFISRVQDDNWYLRIGRRYPGDPYLYMERLDPVIDFTAFNFPTNAADPKGYSYLSGCVSSRKTLAKRTSTTQHINECTSWHSKYVVEDHTNDRYDRKDYRPIQDLQPRQYSELHCYVAKSVDNMFMWHGINNEAYYNGSAETLVASIGPEFAPIFPNLPNKCTSCGNYYSGDRCETQGVDTPQYVGWEGLCNSTYQTCCGKDSSCIVPVGWDGRIGCVKGTFDFTLNQCICDGDGWSMSALGVEETGAIKYCQYNACARNPGLIVISKTVNGTSNPICSDHGVCLGPQGICRCTDSEWGGLQCQLSRYSECPGGSFTNKIECSGHGECMMGLYKDQGYCRCFNQTGAGGYWTGDACEIPHTPDDDTCENNGGKVSVHPTRGVPYCACPTIGGTPVKGGQYCEYSRCPMANGKVCNKQGQCVVNGTNSAGYPSFACRQPLDINDVCGQTDTQCIATTVMPPVCVRDPAVGATLDYDGCACEQPIKVYCAPTEDSPLCSVSAGSPIDQLNACQIFTNNANGTVSASCACGTERKGVFCEESACPGGCNFGTCNGDTLLCTCKSSATAIEGLYEGAHCNISVTSACGFSLISGGDVYKCAGHGQCVPLGDGNYGCECDAGHVGSKCELSDCPAPCDDRSTCSLPVSGGSQKECICKYPRVYSRNTTYPNLCNVDACAAVSLRTKPTVNGTSCECIERGLSFASGCTQAECDTDPVSGEVCGPANPSGSCAEGDCVVADCRISYDYTLVGARWSLAGDSRRRQLCNRYQKRCTEGVCECGLGYSQDPTTGLCTRICTAENTLDIVPCFPDAVRTPLCQEAPFYKSLSGWDTAFQCKCKPAYTGSLLCDTLRCSHGGTVTEDGAACTCPFPWTGDVCTDNLCENGVANFQLNRCDCDFGWSGARCTVNMCENGGVPDATLGACRCPAKWGGATCSVISCRTNNFWNDALQTCVCPSGYTGDFCDIPLCANNKPVDASGACVCSDNGRVNQYIDPLCTYRWCGLGSRVCIGSMCMCICDSRKGIYLDPVTGNCTIPICGSHATFSLVTEACVCDTGYELDASIPLQPCVRDCGARGAYNSIVGTCVCDTDYFGDNCEFSTAAFVQQVIDAPVTLPSGVLIEPVDQPKELQIAVESAPTAIVQVVLFDPFPDPISYQEDAERILRLQIQGYEMLWVDVYDLVQQQGGRPTLTDPTRVPIDTLVVEVPEFDNSLGQTPYVINVLMIAAIAVMGCITLATFVLAISYNMSNI